MEVAAAHRRPVSTVTHRSCERPSRPTGMLRACFRAKAMANCRSPQGPRRSGRWNRAPSRVRIASAAARDDGPGPPPRRGEPGSEPSGPRRDRQGLCRLRRNHAICQWLERLDATFAAALSPARVRGVDKWGKAGSGTARRRVVPKTVDSSLNMACFRGRRLARMGESGTAGAVGARSPTQASAELGLSWRLEPIR